jgi:hypothetical protein
MFEFVSRIHGLFHDISNLHVERDILDERIENLVNLTTGSRRSMYLEGGLSCLMGVGFQACTICRIWGCSAGFFCRMQANA